MTSKISFFKLLKDDLKRRVWTIALATVVFFLTYPIGCALMLDDIKRYLKKSEILWQILNYLEPNPWIILVTVTGAIICGLSGFFYLHSKRKVDLYHSIPVRREVLFFVRYVNGILIYVIPYVISIVLALIVIQINGYMNAEIMATAFGSIGVNLVYYCLIYTVVILADMLTGNFIVNCLGTAVFLLYGMGYVMIKDMYFSSFFSTYYSNLNLDWQEKFISPVLSYFLVARKTNSYKDIIFAIILTIVLTGLSIFLYKKRPSESAGKAIAFRFIKPIIKFLLVIPATLGGGLIFRSIVEKGQDGWFLFGLIFSFLLSYAIIEIIYNFDIRSAFDHKKHLLACAGIVAAITCIFRFDLIQYDSYLPKENSIKSMAVAINNLDADLAYYDFDSNYDIFLSGNEYQLKNMKLKNFDAAYALAKSGLENVDMDNTSNYKDEEYFTANIKYELKNGRNVYRHYRLKKENSFDLLKAIYESPEFKQAHYPVMQFKSEDVAEVWGYNYPENKLLSLNGDEIKELLSIYCEEVNNLTLEQLTQSYPMSSIEFRNNQSYRESYKIYPEFHKTIAFLQEHGFDPLSRVSVSDIKYMNITKSIEQIENDEKYGTVTSTIEDKTIEIVTQEQINEIYPNLIPEDYYWYNQSVLNIEEEYRVEVVFKSDNYGNETANYYFFRKDQVPDCVTQEIGWEETTK